MTLNSLITQQVLISIYFHIHVLRTQSQFFLKSSILNLSIDYSSHWVVVDNCANLFRLYSL